MTMIRSTVTATRAMMVNTNSVSVTAAHSESDSSVFVGNAEPNSNVLTTIAVVVGCIVGCASILGCVCVVVLLQRRKKRTFAEYHDNVSMASRSDYSVAPPMNTTFESDYSNPPPARETADADYMQPPPPQTLYGTDNGTDIVDFNKE